MFIRKSLELGRGSFQSMSQTTGCSWYYNSSFPQKWVHSCTLHVWYWTWAIESSLHCHHMFPVPHSPPQIIITWWDFAIYYSPPKHQKASCSLNWNQTYYWYGITSWPTFKVHILVEICNIFWPSQNIWTLLFIILTVRIAVKFCGFKSLLNLLFLYQNCLNSVGVVKNRYWKHCIIKIC